MVVCQSYSLEKLGTSDLWQFICFILLTGVSSSGERRVLYPLPQLSVMGSFVFKT